MPRKDLSRKARQPSLETKRLIGDRGSEPKVIPLNIKIKEESKELAVKDRYNQAYIFIRKTRLRKEYLRLMQSKMKKLGEMLDPKELSANSIDEHAFLKYMYVQGKKGQSIVNADNEVSRNNKQSSSFQVEQLDDSKIEDVNMSEIIAPMMTEELYDSAKDKPRSKYKPKKSMIEYPHAPDSICEEDNDDDMARLDKLSLINMGARYELLNANQMLVDLDISLRVTHSLFIFINRRCNQRTNQRYNLTSA